MTFAHCLGYVCLTLKITAGIATLVGLGIPYWYKGATTESAGLAGTVKTTIREGLWKKCTDLESSSESSSFCVGNEATSSIQACRGTLFASAGLLGIAILAAGAGHMEKNRKAFITAGVFGIISIVLSLVCLAVYGVKVKDELNFSTSELYAGFWLIALAILLTLVASLTAFMLARMVRPAKKADDTQTTTQTT